MHIQPTPILLATDQNDSVLYQAAHALNRHVAYGPFGHRAPSPIRPGFGFNGQIQELAQNVYLLGHGYRSFSTVTQRFQRPDESSPFGAGGINAYVYCAGDPINYTDPEGRWKLSGWFRRTARRGASEVPNASSVSYLARRASALPDSPPSYSASQALHGNTTSLHLPLEAPPPYSRGSSVFFTPSAEQISNLEKINNLKKVIGIRRIAGQSTNEPVLLIEAFKKRLPAPLRSPPPYRAPERLIVSRKSQTGYTFAREAPPAYDLPEVASNVRGS